MSRMRKRSELDRQKKTYQRADRVTVLVLLCEKMTNRVRLIRQEDEDRGARQETVNLDGFQRRWAAQGGMCDKALLVTGLQIIDKEGDDHICLLVLCGRIHSETML